MNSRTTYLLLGIKIGLLAVAIALLYGAYLDRMDDLDSLKAIIFYAALFTSITLLTFLTGLIQPVYIRVFWAILLTSSFVFFVSYQNITGKPLTYSGFVSLVSARGFFSDTFHQFAFQMIKALLVGLLLFIALALPTRINNAYIRLAAQLAPIVGIAMFTLMLFARGGYGASGIPPSFTSIAYGALYGYELSTQVERSRQSVSIPITPTENAIDLVLIVEESIRGDYLDINSTDGTQSFLDSDLEHAEILNYGLAVSSSNCSDASNLIFRYGGDRERFRNHIRVMPSIWEYAKKAGYSTVYIDNQRTSGEYHNRMTEDEAAHIDSLIQQDGVDVLMRDVNSADILATHLNNDVREFIYVNKVGAHFPVHDKFPDDFAKYQPILPRGSLGDISDTGERVSFFNGDWNRYINSYKNTLRWNVGEYFKQLFEQAKFENALVVYSSDHGQTFHQRGEPGLNTHCSFDPQMEEGVVPMVLIVGRNVPNQALTKNLQANKNRTSHFNIFPSLLRQMGYAEPDVNALYGDSLHDVVEDDYTFIYSFHGSLGRKSLWKKVDIEKLTAVGGADKNP